MSTSKSFIHCFDRTKEKSLKFYTTLHFCYLPHPLNLQNSSKRISHLLEAWTLWQRTEENAYYWGGINSLKKTKSKRTHKKTSPMKNPQNAWTMLLFWEQIRQGKEQDEKYKGENYILVSQRRKTKDFW